MLARASEGSKVQVVLLEEIRLPRHHCRASFQQVPGYHRLPSLAGATEDLGLARKKNEKNREFPSSFLFSLFFFFFFSSKMSQNMKWIPNQPVLVTWNDGDLYPANVVKVNPATNTVEIKFEGDEKIHELPANTVTADTARDSEKPIEHDTLSQLMKTVFSLFFGLVYNF